MVREPFQRVPNGSAIDDAGADATHSVPKVEAVDRLGIAGSDPAQSDHDRAHAQHESGSDAIDQISFKRDEPGFQRDE